MKKIDIEQSTEHTQNTLVLGDELGIVFNEDEPRRVGMPIDEVVFDGVWIQGDGKHFIQTDETHRPEHIIELGSAYFLPYQEPCLTKPKTEDCLVDATISRFLVSIQYASRGYDEETHKLIEYYTARKEARMTNRPFTKESLINGQYVVTPADYGVKVGTPAMARKGQTKPGPRVSDGKQASLREQVAELRAEQTRLAQTYQYA